MHLLKLLAFTIVAFLSLDLLWLGVVMRDFYAQELGDLVRRQGSSLSPRWPAAVLVYLLIPGGLVAFVRPQAGRDSSIWRAFGWGALFGLVLYGVYDLTNLAILEQWTLRMTLADIVWGCVLCGITSMLLHRFERRRRGAGDS